MDSRLEALAFEMKNELENGIMPFWIGRMTRPEGGFYGRITGEGELDRQAPKGAVLTSRMLWAFSAAFRVTGRQEYLEVAKTARRELIDHFYDAEEGGVYWSLDPDGRPLDTKKQIYAIGFAIYGLSEFSRATGDRESLELAVSLFNDIESHSFDNGKNGYIEALARDWSPLGDVRLSDKDENERKTMNTHLHIVEPYTNLYRVWPYGRLKERIENLLNIFTDRILDPYTGHLRLFFDDDWVSRHNIVSYGHDIEASWLIDEAAFVIGGEEMREKFRPVVSRIASAATEGYIPVGGMIYEFHGDTAAVDADRHWWVQAEAVVGYVNMFCLTRESGFLDKAEDVWRFIRNHIVDREGGEWFWSLKADGSVNRTDDKAGFWKCPYHNSRMCLEVIERSGILD
ncbi:MAG: AGE family epimerase/isomerase [Candidatus Cryptobacteroides sp.]